MEVSFAGKIIYKWAIYTMAMLNNQRVSKQTARTKTMAQNGGFLETKDIFRDHFPKHVRLAAFSHNDAILHTHTQLNKDN